LEAVLPADQINLTFQGPPNERLDALLDGQAAGISTRPWTQPDQ
jgi:hypothetical protein